MTIGRKDFYISELKRFSAEGLTCRDAAIRLGISFFTARQYARESNITMMPSLPGPKTLAVRISDGEKRIQFETNRNARYIEQFGCSYDEFKKLSGYIRSRFTQQKVAAGSRGIGWELSLWQWWSIWNKSGHWNERGCKHNQYVMCRNGDIGPYAEGNVFIALSRENSSISSRKKTDLPMGVQSRGRKTKFYATRTFDGIVYHVGTFHTPELAHAAYLNFTPPKRGAEV